MEYISNKVLVILLYLLLVFCLLLYPLPSAASVEFDLEVVVVGLVLVLYTKPLFLLRDFYNAIWLYAYCWKRTELFFSASYRLLRYC